MNFELKQSERKVAKIKLSLQGPPGSGKSMSALLIAKGLTGDYKKIAVVDTERGSANLYSHLGSYYVLTLEEPFTPERYAEAIKLCENNGIECIILDSISHEWSGPGGCLEIHEKAINAMKIPNSFTAWASVTPRHQAFIEAILQCKSHIITTIRSKTEYVISERNGRNVPQKVGMAAVQRDGFEYEVTISLDIDEEHNALSSKDRTGLFSEKGKFRITEETGKIIREWSESGIAPTQTLTPISVDDVRNMLKHTTTVECLTTLYKTYPQTSQLLTPEFIKRKQEILHKDLVTRQTTGGNGDGTAIG